MRWPLCLVVSLWLVPFFVSGELVDLSHELGEDSVVWPEGAPFELEAVSKGYSAQGHWFETYEMCFSQHIGTHLDAPAQYAESKWTVDQIPLERLVGPAVVMDIRDKVSKNASAQLSAGDVVSWLDTHGPLPDGAIVLVRTGWSQFYGNETAYIGPDPTNPEFPGIDPGAANVLVDYHRMTGRSIVGVGIESPGVDHGPSKTFRTHQEFAQANVYVLENLAVLERIPIKGASLTVLPLNIRGGSGGPVRILATLPDTSGSSVLMSSNVLLATGLTILLWMTRVSGWC